MGPGWFDSWEAVGKPAAAKNTNWSRRLDRCFVLLLRDAAPVRMLAAMAGAGGAATGGVGGPGAGGCRDGTMKVASLALVGHDIPGETYIDPRGNTRALPVSDHKGLLVSLTAVDR